MATAVVSEASGGLGVGRIAVGTVVAAALAAAFALKAFYSTASFDDLRWVLAPTAWLVQGLTGVAFELEPHEAYLSRDLLYAIVPSCAGVNFMIAAFCSLVFGLIGRCRTPRGALLLLPAAGLAAYVATLAANALRIAIGAYLHVAAPAWSPLTPGQLHRVEGVAVYFVCMCLLYAGGIRVAGGHRAW